MISDVLLAMDILTKDLHSKLSEGWDYVGYEVDEDNVYIKSESYFPGFCDPQQHEFSFPIKLLNVEMITEDVVRSIYEYVKNKQ